MKVSKSLEDVWRWKDEVVQQTKDMSRADQVAFFRRAGERLAEKTGRKLDLPRRTSRRARRHLT